MQWAGVPAVIGFKIATNYLNHPLSGYDANSIACLSGNWTSVVYSLHSTMAATGTFALNPGLVQFGT